MHMKRRFALENMQWLDRGEDGDSGDDHEGNTSSVNGW